MPASYTCCHGARCVPSTFWLHLPNMSHVEHIVNFPADSQLTASCHLAGVRLRLQHHFRLATLLLIYIFITCRSSSRSSNSRLCSSWKSSWRSQLHEPRAQCVLQLLFLSVFAFCHNILPIFKPCIARAGREVEGKGNGCWLLRTCTSLALVAAN